jgi:prepilin-type N-terminal cleavage/methylation domain-containing protein
VRKQYRVSSNQQGLTLIEVIVTLAVLSGFLIGILGIYSKTYRNIKIKDSLISVIEDSDQIMSYIGNDIRHAYKFLGDYQDDTSHIVVAAMKIREGMPEAPTENLVVYFLDAEQPHRLIRDVRTPQSHITTEISNHIHTFRVIPKTQKLFEVQLILQDQAAGNISTSQVTSKFTMRH